MTFTRLAAIRDLYVLEGPSKIKADSIVRIQTLEQLVHALRWLTPTERKALKETL